MHMSELVPTSASSDAVTVPVESIFDVSKLSVSQPVPRDAENPPVPVVIAAAPLPLVSPRAGSLLFAGVSF